MPGHPGWIGLLSASCSSGPRFASSFLQIPLTAGTLAFGYRFRLLRSFGDFHPRVKTCLAHTKAPAPFGGGHLLTSGIPLNLESDGQVVVKSRAAQTLLTLLTLREAIRFADRRMRFDLRPD